MKNSYDELNSVIKSISTIYDIHHHVMQTVTLKVNVKKEAARFKDTHKEKAQSNKTPALRKSRKCAFRLLVHQINSL